MTTYQLPSSKKQIDKLRRQMGDYCFVRWCKNLGIPPEDCYFYMFGKEPRIPF